MVAARTGTAKILVVSDDPYFYGRVTSATAALPLECGVVYVRDAQHALATTEFDGLILDARDQLSFILEVAERIAIQSVGDSSVSTRTPILVHLRPQDLAKVRFPEKLNCDFFVEGATGEEIAARLRFSLWPREIPSHDELVLDGPLAIDLATYQVYLNGEALNLAYLEYALLAFLVTHPNRTHTREQLLRRVWGGAHYGGSRTVDVHVRRVRAKLDPASSQRLETVRGIGYLWRSA